MREIVSNKNSSLINSGKKLLVGYLLAGYPKKDVFLRIVANCEAEGVDIFEIGFPSAEPSSDGEIIRNAHLMVDESVYSDESYWKDIRRAVRKPIWVMAYKKDLIGSGFYSILAKKGLIDALVIPDMSFEEHQKLGEEVAVYGVDVVGFVNPEMDEAEMEMCFSNTALVYQQLYSGPTGMSVVSDDFKDILEKARKYEHVKVFAGFGISTPERVKHLLRSGFNGVIVGTAMIRNINKSEQQLLAFVSELSAAAEKAGEGNEVYCDI